MKYGVIGCGNMGFAIVQALYQSTKDIQLADPLLGQKRAEELGLSATDNAALAGSSDRVVLAVKPQMLEKVVEEIRPALDEKKPVIISICGGVPVKRLEALLPGHAIIRLMPNTPVGVGKGVIMYTCNELVDEAVLEDFVQDMRHAGIVDRVDEKLFNVGTALSGCGPAYVYLFIEALADGAVACGLPRAKALQYAAAMVEGSAALMLQSGKHPGELKDAVCTPGGITIMGVKALEEAGFRAAAFNAVYSAYMKDLEMSK